jgi:hypothetical protein
MDVEINPGPSRSVEPGEIKTWAQVIELWPKPSGVTFAEDIGVSQVLARSWKRRGIPSAYWTRVVNCADRRDIDGLTLETLAVLDANTSRGVDA